MLYAYSFIIYIWLSVIYYCRLHSMQRIHLKHHMSRGHRDIAFSLHLVMTLADFISIALFPFKNGWASCSYPTGYVFEEKALLAFRYLLDKDFACLELWLAPYQSTIYIIIYIMWIDHISDIHRYKSFYEHAMSLHHPSLILFGWWFFTSVR